MANVIENSLNGNINRGTKLNYNPNTRSWVRSSVTEETPVEETPVTYDEKIDSGGDSNLTATTGDSNSAKGKALKEYNNIVLNILVGELDYIVNKDTIKIKAGDTIELNGLGKYLSGRYYVKEVHRTLNSSGYSHSATVIKTDFGNKIKASENIQTKDSIPPEKPKEKVVPSTPKITDRPKRYHTVVSGDTLWGIAVKYYGDGAEWNKIYSANKDKCSDIFVSNGETIVLIYPGQRLLIP